MQSWTQQRCNVLRCMCVICDRLTTTSDDVAALTNMTDEELDHHVNYLCEQHASWPTGITRPAQSSLWIEECVRWIFYMCRLTYLVVLYVQLYMHVPVCVCVGVHVCLYVCDPDTASVFLRAWTHIGSLLIRHKQSKSFLLVTRRCSQARNKREQETDSGQYNLLLAVQNSR